MRQNVCRGCGSPAPRCARRCWRWQRLHFRFGLPQPPLEPLAVERLYLDNYFSVAKATRDLGYRPLFTTEQAMAECLPYYTELFDQMKAAAQSRTGGRCRARCSRIDGIFRVRV